MKERILKTKFRRKKLIVLNISGPGYHERENWFGLWSNQGSLHKVTTQKRTFYQSNKNWQIIVWALLLIFILQTSGAFSHKADYWHVRSLHLQGRLMMHFENDNFGEDRMILTCLGFSFHFTLAHQMVLPCSAFSFLLLTSCLNAPWGPGRHRTTQES